MRKAVDLSDFDRGKIEMSRRHGTSISETALLVDLLQPAVVSSYAKWIKNGGTSKRCHSFGNLRAVKGKSKLEIVQLCKAKSIPDSPIQYRAM